MAFKLRSGNSPKFKMVGSSPLRNEDETVAVNSDDTTESSTLGEGVDKKRKQEKVEKEIKDAKNSTKRNPTHKSDYIKMAQNNIAAMTGGTQTTPPTSDTEYNDSGDITSPEKNDFFSGLRPLQQALGLSKEQRAARKAKKAKKLTDAKTAIKGDTQTLKQQKLVDRTNKRQRRKDIRDIRKSEKDRIKLVKYNKRKKKNT